MSNFDCEDPAVIIIPPDDPSPDGCDCDGIIEELKENIENNYYDKEKIQEIVDTIESGEFLLVEKLPEEGAKKTIYLVPKSDGGYNEYLYINGEWDLIGDTDIDLGNYYTKTETDNLLEDKQDILSKQDILDILGYEEISARITESSGNIRTRTILAKSVPDIHTVLYSDGVFIINELSDDRQANIEAHGEVVKEYDPLSDENQYVFSNKDECPWANERGRIKYVYIGSKIKPVSISYWFAYSGVYDVDWTNADLSETESSVSTFYGASSLEYPGLGNIELKGLKNAKQMFRDCSSIEVIALQGTDLSSLTTATGMFQNSSASWIILTNTDTSNITSCERMFADMANLEDIDASESTVFTNATASTNMFRGCTKLKGGNGTPFNSSYIDKTYARIDKPGTPGYFMESN